MPSLALAVQSYRMYDSHARATGGPRTLVGHKTSRVVKAFRDALAHGKIEAAIHWSGELVISGNVWPIWESLFLTASMYYYNHQQMVVYLADRYRRFREIATGTADIELRNVDMVRSIVAEASAVVASSDRRFKATRTPVADEMFALDHLRPHMKAPTRDLARPYILEADPPEVAMCANELAYALANQRLTDAQFWVEWLLAWQRRCIRQKAPCVCGVRGNANMSQQIRTTPALLLWSVHRGVSQRNAALDTTIAAWEQLFVARYTGRVNTARTLLLLAATYAICNRTTLITTLPITNPKLVPSVIRGLPRIYQRLAQQASLEFRGMQEGKKGKIGSDDSPDSGSGIGLLRMITPSRHHPQ